jgi:hypothetical protein
MSVSRFGLPRRRRLDATLARGSFDQPATATVSRGHARFEGWALQDDRAVTSVDLVFNATTRVPARLNIDRPDVPAALQQPRVTAACGWAVTVDLEQFAPGKLAVEVVVGTASGRQATLGTRVYELVDGSVAEPEQALRSPRWEWDLPEFLADVPREVSRQISARERMPRRASRISSPFSTCHAGMDAFCGG